MRAGCSPGSVPRGAEPVNGSDSGMSRLSRNSWRHSAVLGCWTQSLLEAVRGVSWWAASFGAKSHGVCGQTDGLHWEEGEATWGRVTGANTKHVKGSLATWDLPKHAIALQTSGYPHALPYSHKLKPSLDSSILSGAPPAAPLSCCILLNGDHEPSPGTPCHLPTPSNITPNTRQTSLCPSFSPWNIEGSSISLIYERKKKVRARAS